MAVQAGCGFKAPTPVFAVSEPPRRLEMTSSPPRDPGSDVIMAGRRSGQWVTLSKTLLLQLVERICQLSFQSESNTSSRLYRKSADEFGPEVEIQNFWRRPSLAERGGSPSEHVLEKDNGQDTMEDYAIAEDRQTPACQDDSVPTTVQNYDHTTSGFSETSVDVRSPAVSCCDADQNSTVDLDVVDASSDVEKAPTDSSATVDQNAARGTSDASTSDERRLSDRHRHYHQHHRRHQRSACRRRLLRTRRHKRAALATSGGQVRCQLLTRRGGDDSATVTGRRPHLRGVRRCRQSWMALSKDIVYGAVENELRHAVDGSRRSVVPAVGVSSPAKSTAIWNPATCLSPSEKRRSRPSRTDLDCAPALSDFPYREVMFRYPESDVMGRPCAVTSVASSSMLSELLGFGSATSTVVLPAEIILTRQRRCAYSGGETTACDVISPSVGPGSGVKAGTLAGPVSESGPSHGSVASGANYCNSNPDEEVSSRTVPRIWRPVGSYPVQSITRVTRPRWVAVNKGDVCSLVDNLVLTMIASEDRSSRTLHTSGSDDARDASTLTDTPQPPSSSSSSSPLWNKPALPVSACCSLAASEPRKWKSDLLQRLRNEDS